MHSVFYTSLLLFAADVIGVVIEMPLNAVAEVGQKAMFNCSTNLLYQNWILAKKREDLGTPESEKITTNCVVRPAFTAHYEVYRPAEDRNVCDLIVKDTTMQQAGIYTCMEAAPDATPGLSAILTVTDSSPAITVNNTNDLITVMENDTIVIRCVLNYNGSVPPAPTLRPCFYWTNFNGQNVSSYFDSWSTSLATSELRVKVGRQDIMPYTCHVCFELLPPTPTGYANNTPTVSNNATSPIIKILSPYSSTDESTISTATISTTKDPCNLSTGLTTDPTVSSTTDDPCTTINTEVETTTVETTAQPTTPTTTQPLDLCNSSPCRNGATCMDVGNTFNCTCVPGFTGTICDVEINECETNPCYPFGKCTDLIGDYNCTCNPGYEANDTKSCIETNFCALESEPCENGGTCVNQNALNRYFCLCPVLNDKQYVGLHCETVLVTSPIVHGGISPTSGIIAGGASVTIRGQGLDLFEPLGAYLIDTPTTGTPKPTLYAYVIPNLTLSDSIAVQIPPADIAYVDLDLLVIVEYTGPINVTSDTENLRFKYTGNPVITTIEPKEILVSGGVHLTISGSNMDTVQNPVMEITTFVVNKTAGNSEKNFSREICSLRNTSTITCLIPQGIVPSSFINDTESVGKSLPGVAHLESLFRHKRGRRTKRAPVANLTDDTGNTFEMYLGFIFDQYPTYNNISKSLPHVTLSFVQPKISFKPGVSMDFVSNKQDIISLYGSGFTHGCSMDDYQVNISDAPCIVNSLTDNELQCRPPKEEPKISDDSMHCEFDQHPVMVHVGDMSYLGCCVSYTTDYTDLIIGVTVICVVVVAIIILVAVLVYKRHKNQRKGKGSDDDSIIAHKPIGVMSPTPAHVHTQSDDYDDVITSDVSNVDVSLANQTTVVEIRSGTSRADIDYLSPRASQVEFNSNDIRGDRNGRTRDSHAQVYRDRDFLDNAKLGDRPISEPAIDYLIEDDPDY